MDLEVVESIEVEDAELTDLLTQVYVDGGYTDAAIAGSMFEPSAVRQRGTLFGARDERTNDLAGIVILVPPESKARRIARGNEVEMQLLGVKSNYRNCGLGRLLILNVIAKAKYDGRSKIILWTQPTMVNAQRLYESFGFSRDGDFEQNGRKFIVYTLVI
ncbi:MAG: GNAT family N-acetyltransferase [Gammaproteobacteria bacterium]